MSTDSRGSKITWATAGVPLLAAFVQTLLALFGYTSNTAGLQPLAEPVLSIDILYEAAVVFKDSSAVVMLLFLLIAGAWVVQGVTTFLLKHREASYGAATLSSVLFFALFFGVYAPLLATKIPAVQRALFFLVPVVAAVCQFYSVWQYPWNEVVLTETGEDLGRLESRLSEIRSSFETRYRARFDGIGALSQVAPSGIDTVKSGRDDFRDRLDELEAKIEECQHLTDAGRAQAKRAEVENALDKLSVERRLDELDREFSPRLVSGIRTRYGNLNLESRYGDTYELVNLPTKYREVTLPDTDGPVHIQQVGDVLVERVQGADSYEVVATAVEVVDQHYAELKTYVKERESSVAAGVESATSSLETMHEVLDSSDAPFADRVRDILVKGRETDVENQRSIENRLDRCREALHECRFGEAERLSTSTADDASDLVSVAEYLSTLHVSVENRHDSVSVPADIDDDYVRSLMPAIQGSYDQVTVTRAGGELRFGYEQTGGTSTATEQPRDDRDSGDATPDAGSEVGPTSNRSRGRVPSPEEVVDEVLFAFREFRENANENDVVTQYTLEDLPDAVARREVLVNVERFAGRQSDLFDAVDLQSPEPPGFIEFKPVPDSSPGRALDEVHRRFREKYA